MPNPTILIQLLGIGVVMTVRDWLSPCWKTAMERMGLLKKSMVYPVQVELCRMASDKRNVSSWCNGDLNYRCSTDDPGDGISSGVVPGTDDVGTGLFTLYSKQFENLHQDTPVAQNSQVRATNDADLCGICTTSNNYIPHSNGQLFIQERMQRLICAFTERAQRIRQRLDFPPTPSTASSEQGDDTDAVITISKTIEDNNCWSNSPSRSGNFWCHLRNISWNRAIDPQSFAYIYWLSTVTFCFTYNCCVIPLRSTFPYQNSANRAIWLACDYLADLCYLIDIVVVRPRVMFLEDGFWVKDPKLTCKNYMKKWQFKTDVLSLLPLDLLFFFYGYCQALLRIPRFLKVQTFWELYNCMDSILSNPHVVRIARTLSYMLYLIHINACAYYAFSAWEGLGSNSWVFNGIGNAHSDFEEIDREFDISDPNNIRVLKFTKGVPHLGNEVWGGVKLLEHCSTMRYIRCFYFATKTATSIGKNPKPENEYEYMFMTASWLMGVFVFALLIGQIRDIITTATYTRTEYRKLVDETLEYMRRLNLPRELQERVKLWFTFTWEQQHTLDETRILDSLPMKMKTDVAINVHIQTLSKVQLFHDCDEALLRELVLKLRSVMFLPGDTICRKGEVGKEMYIVKTGQVQVIGGAAGSEVLATLTEGSVFGEISLLALNGGNRRTADVRSHGFSNLFVLSKSDLNEAILYHPEAQEILKKKARSLMRKNAAREKTFEKIESEVIKLAKDSPPEIPRLIQTVLQIVSEESMTAQLLKYGSQRRMQTLGKSTDKTGLSNVKCQSDETQVIHGSDVHDSTYLRIPAARDNVPSRPKSTLFELTQTARISTCFKKNLNNNTDPFFHKGEMKKTMSEPCLGLDAVNTFQCMVTVHQEMY